MIGRYKYGIIECTDRSSQEPERIRGEYHDQDHDGFFGTITDIQTHYFWPDLEQNISEVFRVLKAGGTFVIISEVYKINYHMKQYTKNEEIDQLFRKVGFQTVNIHENNKWRCYAGKK